MEKNFATTTLSTTSTNSFKLDYPTEAVHKATVKCVEIYSRKGGRFMSKEVLQDLTQDIELKVFLAWSHYDPSKSKLETWVSRIATNCIRDAFRREKRRAEMFIPLEYQKRCGDDYIESVIEPAVSGNEAYRDIESREALDYIQKAIDSLPENQGYILSLSVDEDLKPKQIATVIGCTPQAVSSHLFRARHNAAERLGKDFLAESGIVS